METSLYKTASATMCWYFTQTNKCTLTNFCQVLGFKLIERNPPETEIPIVPTKCSQLFRKDNSCLHFGLPPKQKKTRISMRFSLLSIISMYFALTHLVFRIRTGRAFLHGYHKHRMTERTMIKQVCLWGQDKIKSMRRYACLNQFSQCWGTTTYSP